MNHGSLFSGLGGFDLAASWMGWTNVFSCEIEDFPNQILEYYWPDAHHFRDICTTDFRPFRGLIDILTGGFPCQPFSTAGRRKGAADTRFLWPQMLRAIDECAPRFIVGENVPGLLSQGGGVVFRGVCADLERAGYQVQVLNLPAAGIGAPHKRERIWFVAYNPTYDKCDGNEWGWERQICTDGARWHTQTEWTVQTDQGTGLNSHAAYTSSQRLQGSQFTDASEPRTRPPRPTPQRFEDEHWYEAATRLCRVDDGFSGGLRPKALPKGWRAKSLKGYGNAIVPEVAYQIFQAIEQASYTLH